MAADLLRRQGFAVAELGTDTPADSVAEVAAGPGVLAVGLAGTTDRSLAGARQTIEACRGQAEGVPVLLGGAGVPDGEGAAALGADINTGGDARGLVAAVASLWEHRHR